MHFLRALNRFLRGRPAFEGDHFTDELRAQRRNHQAEL